MQSPSVKVALAQMNVVVGDLQGNADRIIAQARAAHAAGVDLLVTPELALCGYTPEALLLRPAFLDACEAQLRRIAAELAGLAGLQVVVGHPRARDDGVARERSWSEPPCLNAASVLGAGRISHSYAKRELPNYQVFDERRYFYSGRDAGLGAVVFEVRGLKVGLLEDEARALNAPYLKRIHTALPWVLAKWAQSLDGRVATAGGHSQWISSCLLYTSDAADE